MTQAVLLLAMILILPSLSFGQTVCGIAPGSPVSLSETGSESLQLSCPGVTFLNLGPNGFNTFVMNDDATHVSDFVFASNGLGGVATVLFQSNAVETGSGVDSPSNIILNTIDGESLTFTSDNDSSVGLPSDFASATTPEPATMLLFGTGLLAAAGIIRRRMVRA